MIVDMAYMFVIAALIRAYKSWPAIFLISKIMIMSCLSAIHWTSHWASVGLMWVHRLRRWTHIKPTLAQHLVFAGWVCLVLTIYMFSVYARILEQLALVSLVYVYRLW